MKLRIPSRRTVVGKNVLLMLVFQLAGAATPLLVFPYLIRELGETVFGHLAYAYTAATALAIVVEYGFNFTAVRDVARFNEDRDKKSEIYFKTQVSKLVILVPASFIYFGLCLYGVGVGLDMALAGFPILVAMAVLPFWFYQAVEQLLMPVVILVLGRVLGVGLIFFFVDNGDGVYALALLALGVLAPSVLLAVAIRRDVKFRAAYIVPGKLWAHLREGRFVFISNAAGAAIVQGPVIILGFYLPASSLGVYAAIDKLCFMLRFSYQPFTRALFPYFSRAFDSQANAAFRKLLVVALVGASLMACIALFAILFRGQILEIYLGNSFSDAETFFSVMILIPILTYLRSCAVTLGLIPLGFEKIQMRLQFVGGVVLLFTIFLLKDYSELAVFALAVISVEFVLTSMGWAVLFRTFKKC